MLQENLVDMVKNRTKKMSVLKLKFFIKAHKIAQIRQIKIMKGFFY
jgi:hypothetical protein